MIKSQNTTLFLRLTKVLALLGQMRTSQNRSPELSSGAQSTFSGHSGLSPSLLGEMSDLKLKRERYHMGTKQKRLSGLNECDLIETLIIN